MKPFIFPLRSRAVASSLGLYFSCQNRFNSASVGAVDQNNKSPRLGSVIIENTNGVAFSIKKTHYDRLKEMIRVDVAGETAAVRICNFQQLFLSPLAFNDTYDPACVEKQSREKDNDAIEVDLTRKHLTVKGIVDEIVKEEHVHLKVMSELKKHYTAPVTLLDVPFHLGAVAMGIGSYMLGKDAMMCVHEAVEETITNHYNDQIRELNEMIAEEEVDMVAQSKIDNTEDETTEGKVKEEDLVKVGAINASKKDLSDRDLSATKIVLHSVEQDDIRAQKLHPLQEFRDIIVKFRDEEMHHQALGTENGAARAPAYPLLHKTICTSCKLGIMLASSI